MNKAAFERALKAVASGKSMSGIRVVTEDGTVFDIDTVSFESKNQTIWLEVIEAEEEN